MSERPGWRLFDVHTHTNPISLCSRMPADKLIDVYKADHIGGMVLTNHYKSAYIKEEFTLWRRRYVEAYHLLRDLGEKAGIRVLFGLEVTPDCMPRNDFTIYGLTEEQVLAADPLCRLTLPELSDYVHERGALIFHAHPYRNTQPVNPAYVDGVEVNCHPLYRSCHEERVREWADRFRLGLTCGSDYHGDTYKAHCGMWIPETVTDLPALVDFLRRTPRPELVVAPDPAPDAPVLPGCGGECGI